MSFCGPAHEERRLPPPPRSGLRVAAAEFSPASRDSFQMPADRLIVWGFYTPQPHAGASPGGGLEHAGCWPESERRNSPVERDASAQ